MKDKASRRLLVAAFFCVIGLLLGIYAKYSFESKEVYYDGLNIGSSQPPVNLDLTGPFSNPHMGTPDPNDFRPYGVVGLAVMIDEQKGYSPEGTNAAYNCATFYKDYLPNSAGAKTLFYVVPNRDNAHSSGRFDGNYSNDSRNRYGFYDSSSEQLMYYKDDEHRKAIVGWKVNGKNYPGGIFKPVLKQKFEAGGMAELMKWETFFDTSYTKKSIEEWRYLEGDFLDGIETRLRDYMGIGDLDTNNIASWTQEQRYEAFYSYLDLLLTCRYAVADSPIYSKAWTDVINGYLNEGVGTDYSNYNLVLMPILVAAKGNGIAGTDVIYAPATDWFNWAYGIQRVWDLGLKEKNNVLTGTVNTGGEEGLLTQLGQVLSANHAALGRSWTEYPVSSSVGHSMAAFALNKAYDLNMKTWSEVHTGGWGFKSLLSVFITDKEGKDYYGKQIVMALPLAESPLNQGKLKHHFRVYWTNDGSNYFQTTNSNVSDTVAFVINLDCEKEDLAAWDQICNTYDKFYLSFNLRSTAAQHRVTENTKEGGVTSGLNPPSYAIDGSNYTLGTKVEVSREELRKLIKGEVAFIRLYDKSTNPQVITMGETQNFGYDLNVIVHYEDKTGTNSNSCDTGWTGWSLDTGDLKKQQAQHEVSVFRDEDNPQKIRWYSSPEAYSEIKEGTVDYEDTTSHEAFEAMAGVPSTEMLYFASGGSEFIVELELERVEGEEGLRRYEAYFNGTECEFKHNDGFWKMEPKKGTQREKEDVTDNNIVTPTLASPNANLQTGEEIIEKFLVADETGQDIQRNFNAKTPVQWYKWAVAGTGNGGNGTTATVTQNEVLNGHSHAYDHSNPVGDKQMAASTVTATWTGKIWNSKQTTHEQAPSSSHISGYIEGNPAPSCKGGQDGYAGDFAESDTMWDVSGYHSAVDQAIAWAKAYEATNDTYTAKMLADSDGFTRVWRIGNAKIDISFSGGTSNQGTGSRPAGSYTSDTAATAKKPGDQPNFGYNFSYAHGTDGKAGTHGDDPGPPAVPHANDQEGVKTVGSTVDGVGDITYTIKVTFDNGTFDAHELCGTCCGHELPQLGDFWIQKMKYDYARLTACKVYKIYRSYLEGGELDTITFADYNSDEDIGKDAQEHLMYSGPINNYTVDTGAFESEDRFFTLDVKDKDRARQVITAEKQSKLHNGTDMIVAAVNQGDPNIFYNIAMMMNEEDYGNGGHPGFRSYAEEVEAGKPSMMNSWAGRVRYSYMAPNHHRPWLMEYTQRGDYTGYSGTDNLAQYSRIGYGGQYMGTRSNKCDGMTETQGATNPIKVVANGHSRPTVTVGYGGNQWYDMFNPGRVSTECKNFSNGITYNMYNATFGGLNAKYYEAFTLPNPRTFWSERDKINWWCTDDEYWMGITTEPDWYECTTLVSTAPTKVETNGGGVLSGGKYDYSASYDQNYNSTSKTKYTANSIDALDYQTEEYHRFRYRRNIRNTAYIISDMLILQTSSGDQPVLYHWKSQTKRTQQHYDYTVADVDPLMAQFDSKYTNTNITLTETFEDMWVNQLKGEQYTKANDKWNSAVTMTVNGWKSNNVGTKQGINVGGYLGLYDQPDKKYSSGVNKYRVATLFDMLPFEGLPQQKRSNRVVQGNDYNDGANVISTFNELAVRWPLVLGYYYPSSPEHSVMKKNGNHGMDFGANKYHVAQYYDSVHTGYNETGFPFTGVSDTQDDLFNAYHYHGLGPQMVWRYETTVDNPNPDMYKATPNAMWTGFGEDGTNSYRGAEYRMDRPASALRIVTDKIQINPTISNRKYDTGEATQTYMKILDWPTRDIGNMNYVDVTKGGGGNPTRYDKHYKKRVILKKFIDEEIDIVDVDTTNKRHVTYESLLDTTVAGFGAIASDAYASVNKDKTYTTMMGYKINAPYSKSHTKINDIVIHTPVSVQNAVIVHNETGDEQHWYADTRTGLEDITATALSDKLAKLEVCSGDPDTCEFRTLKCVYPENEVVFSTDFDTGISADKRTITNLAATDKNGLPKTYQLPTGFTIDAGIVTQEIDLEEYAKTGIEKLKNVTTSIFNTGNHLACFGTRWSIPMASLNIDSNSTKTVDVDMDFYMDDRKTRGTMVVSFNSFDFYIPYGQGEGIGTFNTGQHFEKKYTYIQLYDNKVKMKLRFNFDDALDTNGNAQTLKNSELYINGNLINTYEHVSNSDLTIDRIFGKGGYLNIGSWLVDDNYPAQFYIDNLKITKIASDRVHKDYCYAYVQEHEVTQSYDCEINYSWKHGNTYSPEGTHITDRPYIFVAPQSGVYKVEAWGGAGGSGSTGASEGGKGGYSQGYITLLKGEQIFVYPGGSGAKTATQTTGLEYFWVMPNKMSICGQADSWNATYPEVQSGVNYINSINGQTQQTNETLHGVWSATMPTSHSCGAHSVSVAIDSTTGKMISRAVGGGTTSKITTFNYKGSVQTYIAPETGTYTVTAYGAQGGADGTNTGGLGGKVSGNITLTKGQTVYVYVGGAGSSGSGVAGGFNGGGRSGSSGSSGSGGGASDIRVGGTALDNRIMVAGGGGGAGNSSAGATWNWYHNESGCTYAWQIHETTTTNKCSYCGHSCGVLQNQTSAGTGAAGGAGGAAGSGDNGVKGQGSNKGNATSSVCNCYHCGNTSCGSNYCSNHMYACAADCPYNGGLDGGGGGGGYYGGSCPSGDVGAKGGSNYLAASVVGGSSQAGIKTGNGQVVIENKNPSTTNTWAGAGFNGGGSSGVNGYGGGGATDIRRLSANTGGQYILNTVSKTGLNKNAKNMMADNGTLTYGPYDNAVMGTYQVDIYGEGLADCTFDVYDNAYTREVFGGTKTYSNVNETGWKCTDGQYHLVVFDPGDTGTITLDSTHHYIIGYHNDGCGYPGSTYYPNNWGHLKDLTTDTCLSCGHNGCAFDTSKYPSWTVDLKATQINQRGDTGLSTTTHVIYSHDELLDMKISPTHVSFYFELPVDCTAGGGNGLEVRINHTNAITYRFDAEYISRLEDRIIVAGGGGGADDAGGTPNGANDGSGGAGGGLTGGRAKCDGIEVTPGTALTAELQATVNSIKNAEGAWKAIQGINRSGCGLGGSQTSGYALGRGENVSYTTDTGGAGGGYYGGYVTNHNNGGAGGGSGNLSGQVEKGNMFSGVNSGEGMVSLTLVAHENETTYQQAWGYTGNVQTWTVPEDGEYRLELWGAQGGKYTSGFDGAKGGYTTAIVKLRAGEKLNLYVGQMGYSYPQNQNTGVPFNGGGEGNGGGGDGGGATDIRYGGTVLSNRILVAGAGGGSDSRSKGGVGGNETGGKSSGTVETASSSASGGTQYIGGTGGGSPYGYGGKLGIGGGASSGGQAWRITHTAGCGNPNAVHISATQNACSYCGHGSGCTASSTPVTFDAAGGGSGYYGGAAGWGGESAGGGGSSYIAKKEINGLYISGGKMLSGAESQPSKANRVDTQVGNTGHGAIRVTKIDRSHNATCKYVTSTNNVHVHNINCFKEESYFTGTQINPLLENAINLYNSTNNDTELRALVGNSVMERLKATGFKGKTGEAALQELAKYIGTVGQVIPEFVGNYLNPIYVCNSSGYHSGNSTDRNKYAMYNDYNTHICSEKCENVNKVLRCQEPHHSNRHYETADEAADAALTALQNQYLYAKNIECLEKNIVFTKEMQDQEKAKATLEFNQINKDRIWHSCYEACNDDAKHRKTHYQTKVGDRTIGDFYINTDEYFDIYFPNTGDFAEDPSLHGIRTVTKVRGMGYEDNMDTGRFEYPDTSQNYIPEGDRDTYESGKVSWVRERYVKFNFDTLFYRAETGVWEEYLANTWIELPVEGWEDDIGINTVNNSFNDTDDSDSKFYARINNAKDQKTYDNKAIGTVITNGHPRYHFYCLMNNNEQASAKIEFESEAINCENSNGKYNYKDNYGYTGDWVVETITGDRLYQKQRDRNDRVVYNNASNHINDNDNPTMDTNKERRVNFTSLHGDHVTKYTDVVGRIGNIAITSTTDIRFANLFKRPDPYGTYLINGVVMEVLEGIQRDYLTWHYNNGNLAYDVRHRGVSAKTGMYNTWGSAMWKGATECEKDSAAVENATQGHLANKLEVPTPELNCDSHAADVVAGHNADTKSDPQKVPLASDRNNLNIYRNELLKPGYTVNYEVTTTGNYQNKLQVKPYFYVLDLDSPGSAKLTPIDVWMKTDDEYKAINFFGATDGLPLRWSDGSVSAITDPEIQEMINTYILDLDWKNEKDLRMFTQMEETLTKAIQDHYVENEASPGQTVGIANLVPVSIPTGDFFKLGNLQSQEIGKKARTFIGTRFTLHENFRHSAGPDMFKHTPISGVAHDTNVWDRVNDLKYTYQTQRWHLKLGLPSSAVFTLVQNGVHYQPLEEKLVNGEKVKAFEEVRDGHYAIVMTCNIKAIGSIWNIYYTQSDGDRTRAPKLHHNGVVKLNNKTYTFDSSLYEFTTGELDDSQVVLALYDNNDTSEVDVDTISTH